MRLPGSQFAGIGNVVNGAHLGLEVSHLRQPMLTPEKEPPTEKPRERRSGVWVDGEFHPLT